MTMKEFDKNATLKVGNGADENKSGDEWSEHLVLAIQELADGLENDEYQRRLRRSAAIMKELRNQ